MDDLDKELFSSTLKKKNMAPAQIDFDEEDPLKDLLSSSGENTPVRKTPLQKTATGLSQQQSKSKLIADLFGLNDQEEVKTSAGADSKLSSSPVVVNKTENPGDWLGLKAEPDTELNETFDPKPDKNTLSMPKLQHSISKKDTKEVDVLTAFETRERSKTENITQASTSSAISDITAKVTVNRRSVQDNRKTNAILSSFLADFDSRPVASSDVSELKTKDNENELHRGKNPYTPSASREPRRSFRRKGGDLVDPLGLFSSSENTKEGDSSISRFTQPTKDEVKLSAIPAGKSSLPALPDQVPSWLGEGTPLSASASAPINQVASITHEPSAAEANPSTQSNLEVMAGLASLEVQAGETATQQQKSLITALALKRQEDVLLKLQTQQTALLAQHEQQLGALVQRQMQRQQQMIRQQEQIQAHIEALMVQPPVLTPITLPPPLWESNSETKIFIEASKDQNSKDMVTIIEQKEKILKLEKENQDMKSQLDFEKQRYDSQLTDMENLFRKQLAIQEDTFSKLENRLILEKQAIESEAMIRLSRLKEEHSEATGHQAQRLAQLHGEWLADLQRLSEFHQQAVEMLRSEQTSAIEHWKNLQLAEISAVQDASSNARLLNEAVKNLQESTVSIREIKNEIRKEYEVHCSAKYDMLQKQEAQLAGLREALEKQASALDAEKSCLMTMTRDMESRLLRQEQEFDNQKNKFEAREKAWEKEKTGAVELLAQEKKHLERLHLEAEGELAELSDRKLALAAEVARLEATLHIQNTNARRDSQNAEQMVAEARSTLEAAQEAGKEVQKEREEIMALKSCINKEERRLDNLEREIQAREQKIEENIMRAKALKEEGLSALDEARRLERERTEHASDLAQRLLYLKEREDRLAEEKLAITLEWKKLQETRDNSMACHHCGQMESTNFSRLIKSSENVVDPVPIIMKLEAEQGLDFITLDHPKYHSSFLESVSQ